MSKRKVHECGFEGCEYVNVIHSKIKRHMIKHTGEKPFECEECGYKFGANGALKAHINRVHLKLRPFECEECGYKFSANGDLKSHVNSVHLKLKPFECEECGYKCSFNSDLKTHINRVHMKLKPFECEECGYKFGTNGDLKRHIGTVHLKLKPFECGECGYKCSSNSDLTKHIDTVHSGIKPFECEECGYKFGTSSNLKTHLDTVHLKLKPFECEECGYKCGTNSHLKAHRDGVHLKLKPFECEECGYTCGTNTNLKKHIDTVHLKLKPFECEECGSRFGTNGGLKGHVEMVHLGLKPCSCDFPGCDYKCYTYGSLKRHMETHTPEGQIRRKKQEDRVHKLLQEWGYTVDIETTIKAKSSNCLVDTNRYFSRIDFHVVNCTNMILLLECDEDQHNWYNLSCEFSRMSDVRASLVKAGYTVPIYWIRYNPNGKYHIGEDQVKTFRPERELELKNHLEKICAEGFIPENQVNIHYMYYDLISEETGPELMMDIDFPVALKDCVSWTM